MAKLKILPQNVFIEVETGKDLYSQLKASGFYINSTCGGCASCGRCIINIVEGDEHLNDIPFEERQLLGNVYHITKERLSCQTTIIEPKTGTTTMTPTSTPTVTPTVTIDISMHEQPKNTATKTVKRRTKQEVSKIIEERKEQSKQKPKKLGGGKKPRAFDYKEDN